MVSRTLLLVPVVEASEVSVVTCGRELSRVWFGIGTVGGVGKRTRLVTDAVVIDGVVTDAVVAGAIGEGACEADSSAVVTGAEVCRSGLVLGLPLVRLMVLVVVLVLVLV